MVQEGINPWQDSEWSFFFYYTHIYSPVYTRPLNQFGSQLSLSWLSVNALNRFTSRLLNWFVNHVWEVV